MTHTEGPWKVFPSEPNRIQTTDGVHIADVYMVGKGSKHDNARLIASAPELVRELRSSTNELKMARSLIEDVITQDAISLQIRDNEAAIAKAEGRRLSQS